jgi:hypothetical protein
MSTRGVVLFAPAAVAAGWPCTSWPAEAQPSIREFLHQFRRGLPRNKHIDSHHWVDGMNAVQIRDRSRPDQRRTGCRAGHGRAAGGQGSLADPPPMRFLPVPFGRPVGWKPLKYLLDVGFTRDVWGSPHRRQRGDRSTCSSPPTTRRAWLPISSPNGRPSTGNCSRRMIG